MFEIVVDSAANIPAELVKKYDIKVISFVNYIDGKPLVCFDPDLTIDEEREKGTDYYNKMREGMEIKTGLISIGDFEDYFRNIIEDGKDLIYISLSKNISGTYNSARLAADAVLSDAPVGRTIRIVDALNASLGQGLLAIYASDFRKKGMEINEVADKIESYVPRMNGVFTVFDLKFLSKTGRISGSTALVGNILNIKPILRGNAEGFIVQFDKCRGRKGSIKKLIDLICNNIVEAEKQIIGIAHADAFDEVMYMIQEIKSKINVKEIITTTYDYCTGSHVGPGTIAMFFMAKDRELASNSAN